MKKREGRVARELRLPGVSSTCIFSPTVSVSMVVVVTTSRPSPVERVSACGIELREWEGVRGYTHLLGRQSPSVRVLMHLLLQ